MYNTGNKRTVCILFLFILLCVSGLKEKKDEVEEDNTKTRVDQEENGKTTADDNDNDEEDDEDKVRHTRKAEGIMCYECEGFMNGNKSCYNESKKEVKCLNSGCYVEIHPHYIKRGCFPPNGLNKTFYCKCSYCNDKPSGEHFISYKSLDDWVYDNVRLSLPVDKLICKDCDTSKMPEDKVSGCLNGIDVGYSECEHDEVCFTSVNSKHSITKRGCIKTPVYNSMFYHCNQSLCNANTFDEKMINLRAEEKRLLLPLQKQININHLKTEDLDSSSSCAYIETSLIIWSLFTSILNTA